MIIKEFKKYEVVSNCDLCGSKNIEVYYKPSDIIICVDCKFLFVSPRPSLGDIITSYSDNQFYDGWLKESEGRLKMWKKRYQRMKHYIKSSSKILDYSAGVGTFLHLAKLDGHHVFGTELSASAKKIAAEQYDLELFDSDYFFKSKFHNYFDVITAWHVVEHVASPRTLAESFFKVLKPGGWLFVAVPNVQTKSLKKLFSNQNMTQVFPKLKIGNEIHLSQFNTDTLTGLLRSIGYSIVNIGIDDHYPTSTCKNRIKYFLYDSIYRTTKNNYSPTIFIVAQKNK